VGSTFEVREGHLLVHRGQWSRMLGVPHDRPVVGFGGKTINTLRLWRAAAPTAFDFSEFSNGDFFGAVADKVLAESVTRVLYPDDSTSHGRWLRFLQEYARFRRRGNDWPTLPEKVAIQLNDTHPAMAVPELMRILLDEAQLGWEQAWDLTVRTLAYTNHTLLPEALEKWPVELFESVMPRQLEILYEINRRFLDDVATRYPGDNDRVSRVSLFEECGWQMSPSWGRTAQMASPRFTRSCFAGPLSLISANCFRHDSIIKRMASPRAAGCSARTRIWQHC
jgi:starch phosphorylase